MLYGTALLAACMFAGTLLGDILGEIVGIHSNIGGVGFSMLILVLVTNSKYFENKCTEEVSQGILFWQNMYIPMVVAMTAIQNVVGALSGGIMAFVAGVAAIFLGFALLPVINRISASTGKKSEGEGAA